MQPTIDGLGWVAIRAIDDEHPRPASPSEWGDWGPIAPEIESLVLHRWLVELTTPDSRTVPVGDMSSHAIWYGPTAGSRAMNIGISLMAEYRGHGIGSIAQRLLAEELHREGTVRVEASTDVENIDEQRSLAKAGFTFEGVLRQAQQRSDGWHDLQVWSHLDASD